MNSTVLYNDLLEIARIDLSKADIPVESIFEEMERELQNGSDTFQPHILHDLLSALLLLSERAYRRQGFKEIKKSADLDYTLLFRDALEKSFKTQRQVNYFASLLTVTEKRLGQATSRVLGKTPKEIIDERVMLESKRLLAHTSLSVKEIGYELGFEEPTNFIKYFRKHSQQTPVEFREQFAG